MTKRILLVAFLLFLGLTPSFVKADSEVSGHPISSHSESFASCHSEGATRPKNLPFTSFLSSVLRAAAHQNKPSEEPFAMVRTASGDPSLWLRVTTEQADSSIAVLDSSVEVHFPVALVFNLEAKSDADIVDARLHYQVDKMKYVQVVSQGWADFAPASRIETSWVWDMRKSSLPPGAAVVYWWTVKDAAGNEAETSPSVIHFEDNRYHWRNLTEGDITLSWYEGDDSFAWELMVTCQQGLVRLKPMCHCEASRAEAREHAEAISRPIQIYVYASAGDLQGAMIFPREWTGGAAFTEFGIIAIGISPDNVAWGKAALVHELTHLVVHQATFSPYGRLPIWLDEGLAMYNQGELSSSFQARLDKAISEDKLISVRSLCSPFSAQPEKAYLSYAESYSLVEYLLHNYSQRKMLNLLTLLKQGNTYDEALTQVYGFDVDGLDARWRETLRTSTVIASEAKQSYPALIAVLSALATSLALAGALALEEWTWQRSGSKVS